MKLTDGEPYPSVAAVVKVLTAASAGDWEQALWWIVIPITTGGTIHGMEKTTVYLPAELKAALKLTASLRGASEAEIIRTAISDAVGRARPRPRGGLYSGREPIAARTDELLSGFGER